MLYALFPTAPQSPSIILIGHSLGGAIAVHAASRNLVQNLIGLVVIDVVEGIEGSFFSVVLNLPFLRHCTRIAGGNGVAGSRQTLEVFVS